MQQAHLYTNTNPEIADDTLYSALYVSCFNFRTDLHQENNMEISPERNPLETFTAFDPQPTTYIDQNCQNV